MGTYLSRTPGSAGNRKTWTISFWLKRSKVTSSEQAVFTQRIDSSNRFSFGVSGSGEFNVYNRVGGFTYNATTTAVHRDFSAWYHVVYKMDTTQASSSNRQAIYVNGVEASLQTDTVPSQDADTAVNSTSECMWGYWANSWGNTQNLDGYLAECYMIDGQALTSTSFGQTDSTTGIWKPKTFSGSYGTNGFKLEFKNSGALGTDTSGQSNNFTATNFATSNQVVDTPSNNFSTFNNLIERPTQGIADFSEGNCKVGGTSEMAFSSIALPSSGKWYAEFKATAGTSTASIGLRDVDDYTADGNSNRLYYRNDGQKDTGSGASSYGSSWTTGDIISMACNVDNSQVTFYKNGTAQDSGTAISQNCANQYLMVATAGGWSFQANFGNPSFSISSGNADANGYGNFEYAVPSGYYALCTENLNTYG